MRPTHFKDISGVHNYYVRKFEFSRLDSSEKAMKWACSLFLVPVVVVIGFAGFSLTRTTGTQSKAIQEPTKVVKRGEVIETDAVLPETSKQIDCGWSRC